MPNWCNNTLELTHADPVMIERARKAFNDGDGLLKEFIPIPAALGIVAGSVGAKGTPEQDALEAQEQANLAQYGYKNWYDFCVGEWGTKWDVRADGQPAQDIPSGLMLTFDSAWSPPCDAYAKLVDLGFEVRAMYYEPGMGFAGIWDNGSDDFYEYSGMTSEQVAEEFPAVLDEAFGISESMAEYEAENEEE